MKKSISEYTTVLPVSKKQIKFRPLLVKEEKFIAEIMELSPSISDKLYSLTKLVDSCCNDEIHSLNMNVYDFQHILTEIRRKSISELLNVQINCPYTKEKIRLQINLDELLLNKSHPKKRLDFIINETLKLTFELPTVSDLIKLNGDIKTEEGIKKLISYTLKQAETEKENIDLSLYTDENKYEFIELLTRENYKEIKYFMLEGLYKFDLEYMTSDGIQRKVLVSDFVNFLKFYLATLT